MKKKKVFTKWYIDAIFGSLIGFINGFLGGGGGMIAVPILEKVKKLENKKAHATAIAVIFPLSLVSAFVYTVSIEFDWLTVAILAGSVTFGGIVGGLLLKKLSGKAVRIIFACLMLGSGIYMVIV
ncbi:MAG: sulfite exporter TauE/SafE family protein [Clostridia bacterium]|nr:sulfite exporter TauE/SafE family protein [Clostridia bacterium]